MAIAFVVEGANLSQADYDQAMRAINREDPNAPYPPGVIAHVAGPTENGWRVVDVWENDEAAQGFYGSELFRSMIKGLPPVSFTPWPLHRLEVYRTILQKG